MREEKEGSDKLSHVYFMGRCICSFDLIVHLPSRVFTLPCRSDNPPVVILVIPTHCHSGSLFSRNPVLLFPIRH